MSGVDFKPLPEVLKYQEEDPELFAHYRAARSWAVADGALSEREKLLIFLGAATALAQSETIRTYVHLCAEHGATRAQILEACRVGWLFSGGPGIIAAARGLHA